MPKAAPKKNTAARNYCVTYFVVDMDNLERIYRENDAIKSINGQMEVCPSTGKEHLQLHLHLSRPVRFTAVTKMFGNQAHVEKCKDIKASKEYCEKEESRAPGASPFCIPYSVQRERHVGLAEMRPWQKELERSLSSKADDRQVWWLYDTVGNVGKTAFTRHLATRTGHNVMAVTGGTEKDLACALKLSIENTGEEPSVVILDIPRSAGNAVSYKFVEEVKNGMFFVGKYESSSMLLEYKLHVLVFANERPDETKLSGDRWKVGEIKADHHIHWDHEEGGAAAAAPPTAFQSFSAEAFNDSIDEECKVALDQAVEDEAAELLGQELLADWKKRFG